MTRTDEEKEKHRLYMKSIRLTQKDKDYRAEYYSRPEIKARQKIHAAKTSYKAVKKIYIRKYMQKYNKRPYVMKKNAKKILEAKE